MNDAPVRSEPMEGAKSRPGLMQRLERISVQRSALLVLVVAVLQRLGLVLFYAPVSYSDTHSYWRMAQAIVDGWERYDGTRTPGYAMLLAASGSEAGVWLAQMGMGLLITFLLFWMAWLLGGRGWIAGLAGLAHTLNPGQIFFEANLLSETASTFWLVLSAAGVFWWHFRPERRTHTLALGLALASSMAWITRPLFIFLPVWIGVYLLYSAGILNWRASRSELAPRLGASFSRLAIFAVPALLVIFGWVSYIYIQFGTLGLTTMNGYHMIQHTGAYFEYVPERYAGLRDTYLRYREEQIARHGSQTNTIWAAIPEMQQASGENFYGLSRLLARISADLIREHPDLYLKSAAKGWWYFWRAPVYWQAERFQPAVLGELLSPLVLAGRLGVFGANLLFLATSVLALWGKMRRTWRIPAVLGWLAGSIWLASVVQTLVDHGDNPRFLIPMQSFVVLWVIWIAFQTIQHFQFQKDGTLDQPR
jgi:hypothetical protein